MYDYIIGTISDVTREYIVVDHDGIGFQVHCPNPFAFRQHAEAIKVYTYQHVREDFIGLYGFQTRDERSLFIHLLGVSGIGPKGALAILATGQPAEVVRAIENENEKLLTKFPGIGKKTARQMILDLKGKFVETYDLLSEDEASTVSIQGSSPMVNSALTEAAAALEALGYSEREIGKVRPQLETKDLDAEGYIKEALRLMLKD
ncbi:Holliday junction branch migration protein RuvA [Tuberibacillus sp. Marseille-P3662]|uniref:Holliday junction branch migration protein RuvA n=1 Tax=Tuberibacillus sp. Marseille-P3662 TaxID=1965358 RepID=UPI000A1CB48E|nr:Holliday junction branch migration protein RuvA [Tuberibacillus sp. Marseille-P3662]